MTACHTQKPGFLEKPGFFARLAVRDFLRLLNRSPKISRLLAGNRGNR